MNLPLVVNPLYTIMKVSLFKILPIGEKYYNGVLGWDIFKVNEIYWMEIPN